MANHSLNPPGSALADKGFTPVEYSNAYSQARIQDLCVFVILFAQSCQVYETQLEMFFFVCLCVTQVNVYLAHTVRLPQSFPISYPGG